MPAAHSTFAGTPCSNLNAGLPIGACALGWRTNDTAPAAIGCHGALKLLVYDGTGYWLCLKRFSSGRIQWWPRASDTPLHPLEAQQLSVLLYNGLPDQAGFAAPWRKIEGSTFAQAARATASTSNSAEGSPRA